MKVGLIPVNIGVESVEQMVGLGVLAEELGFESIWTFEHVVVPLDYESKYPYDASGKMGIAPETAFVDPLIALAAVATRTSRIRLGTGVNILSQVNPLYLAKQAASLDFVSNGRLLLGLGIGWLREEFAALGVPFERRGARFDDYVQAMRKVWSGEEVEHQSDFVQWSGFKSYPLPVQDPLPIIVGGSKGKVFERIAKYADGWYAPSRGVDDMAAMLAQLNAACEAHGRERSSVEVTTMWIPGMEGVETVQLYEDLGVSRLVIPLQALATDGDVAGSLQKFAEETLSQIS